MVATLDMLYAIKTIFKAKVIVFGAKNTQKLLENFDFIDKVEIIDFAARGGNQQVLKQINSFYAII